MIYGCPDVLVFVEPEVVGPDQRTCLCLSRMLPVRDAAGHRKGRGVV
ncbi:hypothetical protein [Streptomyces sp. NPDC058955]